MNKEIDKAIDTLIYTAIAFCNDYYSIKEKGKAKNIKVSSGDEYRIYKDDYYAIMTIKKALSNKREK